MRDRYSRILGVHPKASVEEVKKAYRKRAKEYHPDIAGDSAKRKFLEVKKAYEYLLTPDNSWAETKLSTPKYHYTPTPPTDKDHHAWWVKENQRRAEEFKKAKSKTPPPREYVVYQKRLNTLSIVMKSMLLGVILITFPIALIQMNMDENSEQKMNSYLVPTLLTVDFIAMGIFLFAISLRYSPKNKYR